MGWMTREEAIANIEKELTCRNDKEPYCKSNGCCDGTCPVYVTEYELTESLQIFYNWFCELLNEKRTGEDK